MRETKFTYKSLYIFSLIIYIICLPLNAMNIGAIGSALKLLAVLPIGIAIFGGVLRFSSSVISQLCFTVFALLSMAWSVSFDTSMSRVVSYVLLFALIISGSAFTYTAEEIKKIKRALAWSSRLTAAVMLIFAEYVRGRFRLMGIIEEDPNYLCAYLAFGVVYAIDILTKNNKVYRKILAVAELILYFYLILVSGSRGGLLAILSGALIYLLTYSGKQDKHIIKKVILAMAIFAMVSVLIDNLPENLKLRFTVDNVVEDGGTGRTTLWAQAFDLFANGGVLRQLFGYGTATISLCFTRFNYSEINVAHNMFIETLAELGIVGLILYSVAILTFIISAFKNKDKFAFAVIVAMFVMSLSTSIYTFKPYFNIMLFIIMLENMRNEDSKKDVCEK